MRTGAELSRITRMLIHYDSKLMNAYPIDLRINNMVENDKQLIRPIGNKVLSENDKTVRQTLNTSVWFHNKKHPSSNEPLSAMAERSELNIDEDK